MDMSEIINLTGLRGELRQGEPMARHVSWRTGGRASRLFIPRDPADLALFVQRLPPGEPVLMTGLGSNLLVRDAGYAGTVVLTHNAALRPEVAGIEVSAQAGVAAPKVARLAALHGLEGAEFLSGVPGTVGGALAMNAGCYGAQTWEIVERVLTLDRKGRTRERPPQDFAIGYRHCELRCGGKLGVDEWFLSARFRLTPGSIERARRKIKELLARRVATQPLSLPNAGSVFRNPPGDHAARLIESCGLKGLEQGGARVSEKHANFIVNPQGRAKAGDIESLIATVRRLVHEDTGTELIPEVRIVGENA